MTTIKVMGYRDEGLKDVDFGKDLNNFSVSDAVQFSTDRASSSAQEIKGLNDDDVVELIFEEDIHRWVTVAELERDFKYQLSRGGEPGVLEIPSQLPTGDTSRGATSWALKALRVLKFDPVEKVAEKFAETWDKKLMPEPGLYRFDKGLDKRGKELDRPKVKESAAILLFIHGTFSSTTNGFGSLRQETWKLLQQEYGDQIFGYDHYTLSQSPIENALDLVKQLPANAKLHLVTHSRGGLIGELLCRSGRKDSESPFDDDDQKLFADNKGIADDLAELSTLLRTKKISVERFVRVACPVRGTSLASKRLDRWLEVIVNVIGKLLPPGGSTVYGVITDLLLELKKQIANPEAMPGLAAMNPESNFIKMINRPDVQVNVDLSVVAGDIEKNDLAGRLAIFFTDLFYTDEHDLVVQTPAMFGGPSRKEGRYFFHKGSDVNHFNYFSSRKTAEIIKHALTLAPEKLGEEGFRPLSEAYVKAIPDLELSARSYQMLAMLDIRNSAEQLLEVIARFPDVLQLLPMDEDGSWNFVEADAWDKFPNTGNRKWVKPLEKDLEQARKFHALLETGNKKIKDWDSIVYVAGSASGAPVAVDIDKDEIVFRGTNRGDGTVPWETGIMPELEKERTYYMEVPHGDLANHKDSFAAIYDLLNEGATTRLLKTPPRFDRGQEDRYLLRDEGVEIYPSQLDLEATVLGATPVPHQAPSTKPVRVSVVHGNLSFCSNPVAVGHYEGDGLFSAEKALDHHLNGRLSARHTLGRYPGPEGTVEVVLNDKDKKPGGAIIVGLGKAGELSPHKLSNSFTNALREFGVKASENDIVGEDGELTLSTLLIGTGGNGLSVSNSVDAILSGVIQANRSFSQIVETQKGDSRHRYNLRIAEVQFVELFKDQAILAVKALRPFLDNEAFVVNPKLQSLQGGWKRMAYEEPPGWWNRIYIRAEEDGPGSLIFSVPTDRARSEESRLGVQRRNMDRLIVQAAKNPNWDQDLATALFELMIPNRIKGSFKDMQSVLFVVDKEAARIPWELLYDRRSGQDLPLVIQVGMIRQFSTFSFQDRVVDVKNKNVMVVGNPANTPEIFSNLPGAEQEANLVASKLEEAGFQVQRAIHTDSSYIMSHLFSKDYRVLHLAGHGVYEYKYKESIEAEPEVFTGMVLGDGVFLTANEIKKKTDIPELVFINCCHLGKLSSPKEEDKTPTYAYNDFAASLSRELIEMGVKAVIAAGWAVDDAAAMTFAEVFYEHLLKGYRFGDAVKAARVETYLLHKDRTNTWGAYQCYGDPDYRLVTKTQGNETRKEKFVDIDEAIVKINQQYEKAKTASTQGIEKIRIDLQNLSEGLEKENPSWLDDARLLEALGEAFGEAFWFEEAVRYYDRAIESGKSAADIKAIEQSANCHIRLAVQNFENDPKQYEKAKKTIHEQIKKLGQLMDTIGETPERLSMIGSGYKRLAQISSGKTLEGCDSALKDMEKFYDLAWKKKNSTYPLTNVLTARIVQMLRTSDPDTSKFPEIKKLIYVVSKTAEKDELNSPDDFWAKTGVTDVKLLDYLYKYLNSKQKTFSEKNHEKLVEEYKTAWAQYGSAREFNSIMEHYAFLVAVLRNVDTNKNLYNVLEKILNSLKSMYEEED
ncbi:MAG: CHAT domain-containing protein [Anaerolineales bacterium]|nr:CHAT domain-containing protein [Anaerolineales bacterium]